MSEKPYAKLLMLEHNIRYAIATIGSATFGSLVTVIISDTDNSVREWMFALLYPNLGFQTALGHLPAVLLRFAASVAVLGLLSLIVSKRRPPVTNAALLTAIVVMTFLGTAAYELLIGIPGGAGNWQAYNAGGATLADGQITVLGWLSTIRRSFVAAIVVGLTAIIFLVLAHRTEPAKA